MIPTYTKGLQPAIVVVVILHLLWSLSGTIEEQQELEAASPLLPHSCSFLTEFPITKFLNGRVIHEWILPARVPH